MKGVEINIDGRSNSMCQRAAEAPYQNSGFAFPPYAAESAMRKVIRSWQFTGPSNRWMRAGWPAARSLAYRLSYPPSLGRLHQNYSL